MDEASKKKTYSLPKRIGLFPLGKSFTTNLKTKKAPLFREGIGGNNKKAETHHPDFCVWTRSGFRRYETYLQFCLEKRDEG